MNPKRLIEFFEHIERLKRTERSGFSYYGVTNPESVADHSFLVAYITLVLGMIEKEKNHNFNLEKAVEMALIHETGESLISDLHLKARELLGKEQVALGELKAVSELVSILEEDAGKKILRLFEEFERGDTPEAKLVRGVDKLELMLSAALLEKNGVKNLDRFFNSDFNNNNVSLNKLTLELATILKDMRKGT